MDSQWSQECLTDSSHPNLIACNWVIIQSTCDSERERARARACGRAGGPKDGQCNCLDGAGRHCHVDTLKQFWLLICRLCTYEHTVRWGRQMEGEARAVISGGMLTDEECIQQPNQTEHQEPSQQPHLSQDLLMSVGTSRSVCVSHILPRSMEYECDSNQTTDQLL